MTVDQKLMVGFGCDTIPILQYNHNTWWFWVGLNWKLMCLSTGSLWTSANEVTPEKLPPPPTWTEPLETPMQYPDWRIVSLLGGPAHRGGACTRVCNWKVSVDYPHTKYDYSGCPWRMYRMLWWKCTPSAECKTIRVAASAVMDGWDGHTVPSSDVF